MKFFLRTKKIALVIWPGLLLFRAAFYASCVWVSSKPRFVRLFLLASVGFSPFSLSYAATVEHCKVTAQITQQDRVHYRTVIKVLAAEENGAEVDSDEAYDGGPCMSVRPGAVFMLDSRALRQYVENTHVVFHYRYSEALLENGQRNATQYWVLRPEQSHR